MLSSAEVSILLKVSQLAESYGLKPSEADAELGTIETENGWISAFQLSFSGTPMEKKTQFDKMAQALGCDDDGLLITKKLGDMEDAVNRAVTLAPRALRR